MPRRFRDMLPEPCMPLPPLDIPLDIPLPHQDLQIDGIRPPSLMSYLLNLLQFLQIPPFIPALPLSRILSGYIVFTMSGRYLSPIPTTAQVRVMPSLRINTHHMQTKVLSYSASGTGIKGSRSLKEASKTYWRLSAGQDFNRTTSSKRIGGRLTTSWAF